jgi:hypothetical protein
MTSVSQSSTTKCLRRPASIRLSLRGSTLAIFTRDSEALQLGVITALCRIWDKTRGTARITEVVSRLRKNTHLLSDESVFRQWQADVEKIEKSDQLSALRGFRNVGLAHRADPNIPDPRRAGNNRQVLHGDERWVLEATIIVVNRLNDLIGLSRRIDFVRERQDWQRRAVKFWASVQA